MRNITSISNTHRGIREFTNHLFQAVDPKRTATYSLKSMFIQLTVVLRLVVMSETCKTRLLFFLRPRSLASAQRSEVPLLGSQHWWATLFLGDLSHATAREIEPPTCQQVSFCTYTLILHKFKMELLPSYLVSWVHTAL